MKKILSIIPENCTGCQICMLRCSYFHNNSHSLAKSRIYVVRREPTRGRNNYVITPIICIQCGLCMYACPIPEAMKKITKTGAIVVTDKCIGCGDCVTACPYGVIFVDTFLPKAIKCDLCDGKPQCVQHCNYEALKYHEPEVAAMLRRYNLAEAIGRKELVQIRKNPESIFGE